MRIIIYALCLLFSITSAAQERKFYISDPLDIRTTGWNKVLALKGGRALLLHMEDDKPLVVKLFDSAHQETVSVKHPCRLLDIHVLKTAIFKGMLEVGDEVVIFFEQERYSKRWTYRLRISSLTGNMIEETTLAESPARNRPTHCFVMKNRNEDDYAVLFATDNNHFKQCDLHVNYYNVKHELVKEVPLAVERKEYDSLKVVGADAQPNGIVVSVSLGKMVMNKTESDVSPQSDIYNYDVAMYYIPRDSARAGRAMVDVSTDVYPYFAHYTYNPFVKSLNVLLFSYFPFLYQFGIDIRRGAALGNIFLRVDPENYEVNHKWVNNTLVNQYLQRKTDSTHSFYGVPLRMHANNNGLTTVVTESFDRYDEPETALMYDYFNYFGNIGITQLDDDGNEIWGIVLPHAQRFKSNRHYYAPSEIAKREQSHNLFDDLPEQSYERQFVSVNPYFRGKDIYIVLNDYNKNFGNSIEKPGDTVYTYKNTNACYYKINGRKEVTKEYLFGTPGDAEYKTSFIEGADMDERNGEYVTLLQCWKHDNYTLNMAWRKLE